MTIELNGAEKVLVVMAVKADIGHLQTLHDGKGVSEESKALLTMQLDHLRSALAKLQG